MNIVTITNSKVVRLPRAWHGPLMRPVPTTAAPAKNGRVIRFVPRTPSAA